MRPTDWDARYAGSEGPLFGELPNPLVLAERGRFLPGQRVLVPADGDGRHGRWLASLGLRVVAYDISPEATRRALAADRAAGCEVDRRVLGWETAVAASDFDHVVAVFVQFVDAATRPAFLRSLRASLRPGGSLLLVGYRQAQLALGTGGPRDPSHLQDAGPLSDELTEAGFADVVTREADLVLEEGAAHRGPSALVLASARA